MRKKIVEINENLADDEIVKQINGGNLELLQVIIDRHLPTVNYYVRKYCPEAYFEDARQEAIFAIYSAVQNYNPDKSSFSTFATLCIKRSVIGVLKGLRLSRNIPDELLTSIEEADVTDSNSYNGSFVQANLLTITNIYRSEQSLVKDGNNYKVPVA